jgi:hypothetical protein
MDNDAGSPGRAKQHNLGKDAPAPTRSRTQLRRTLIGTGV